MMTQPLTGELHAFGVMVREAMWSRLFLEAMVETELNGTDYDVATRPLMQFIRNLLRLRAMHVKVW